MGSIRVVRGSEIPSTTSTGGMTRKQTDVDEHVSLGDARNPPGTMSGWHHHGDHMTCVYVAEGPLRVEWGPGGSEGVDLSSGDFYVMTPNSIHREGNPGAGEQRLIGFHVGSGPTVVNVDGPEE